MIGGNVTRTHRKLPYDGSPMRKIRSKNEKSQLEDILNNPELKDLPVSKVNRMRSRRGESGKLPDAWDDLTVSAYYEMDGRQHD